MCVLPEVLNSSGLAFEKSFKVEAGLGLVQEHDLHVDVVASRMEEIGLKSKSRRSGSLDQDYKKNTNYRPEILCIIFLKQRLSLNVENTAAHKRPI